MALACALATFCCSSSALGASDAAAKLAEAERAIAQGRSEPAVRLLTEALAADPKLADAWYLRGRENFRLGRGEQSVADFDRYIQLRPELASRQWERGISCYYAGKFAEGAKQFELYQTYHDNDVENSVWRYVCMARLDGPDKARRAMLPIANDTRVPMMEVYRMFRGELTPDQVLAAVDRDQPADDVRAGRLFYARLYLGLYYEAQGQPELARKYILLAADEHRETRRVNRYMWDVARIHAQRYRQPGADQDPNR
ncbi:MAG: tetratricopeptide repeat protein [Pirellulaceae bacterium]|nr:tetratricopeptide repeat protein [Pirellulaceae bacterium]